MFHVEQCDRTKPCWGGDPEASQIHIGPAIWTSGRRFAHNDIPAQLHQTDGPSQSLEWGTKASSAGSIKSMGEAVLDSQHLNVAAHHFHLVLDPQGLHRTEKCVRALCSPIDQGHLDFGANNGNHQARNSCPATQINAGRDSTGQCIGKGCGMFNDFGQGGSPQCSDFLGLTEDTAKTWVICGLYHAGLIV
jgi:hypothetical protein